MEWTIHSMCTFVDVKHNIKPGKLQMISTFFTFAIGITALLGVLEPKIAHNFGDIHFGKWWLCLTYNTPQSNGFDRIVTPKTSAA